MNPRAEVESWNPNGALLTGRLRVHDVACDHPQEEMTK